MARAKKSKRSTARSRSARDDSRRTPDAITLLKADHRQVEDWFSQFEKARDDDRKQRIHVRPAGQPDRCSGGNRRASVRQHRRTHHEFQFKSHRASVPNVVEIVTNGKPPGQHQSAATLPPAAQASSLIIRMFIICQFAG